jgi:hypothetical protein
MAARRRRGRLTVAGEVVVLLVAVVAWSFWNGRQEPV